MDRLVGIRALVIPALLSMGLVTAMAAPVAHGAEPACRIRNVSQGTTGHVLQRMVDKAQAGDRLKVRGTCRSNINGVDIERDLAIRGVGHRPTLTGLDRHTVLWVEQGAQVVLRDLTIERGAGSGAIVNQGRLKLVHSIVQDSWAEHSGGGISNSRRLIVVDSIIRRNRALVEDPREDARGGGIMSSNQKSRLTLRRSMVAGNSVEGRGGGIFSRSQTPVRLVDSIVRGNRADDYEYGDGSFYSYPGEGGGVFVQGPLTLVDSIVRRNRADARGGGIFNGDLAPRFRDDAKLIGSSVTDNTAGVEGGGIWNGGTVTLDATSSVTGNTPDDCVGTPAC